MVRLMLCTLWFRKRSDEPKNNCNNTFENRKQQYIYETYNGNSVFRTASDAIFRRTSRVKKKRRRIFILRLPLSVNVCRPRLRVRLIAKTGRRPPPPRLPARAPSLRRTGCERVHRRGGKRHKGETRHAASYRPAPRPEQLLARPSLAPNGRLDVPGRGFLGGARARRPVPPPYATHARAAPVLLTYPT